MTTAYQIVTLRVPFALGDESPPYKWDWGFVNSPDGEHHVTVLDCDPVSEDPDVQPVSRIPDFPLHNPLDDEDDGERRCRNCGESYNIEDHGGWDHDNGYCVTVTCQVAAGVDPKDLV